MIAVNLMPRVEAIHQLTETSGAGPKEWALVLYVGEPFDFSTPFRAILQEIVACLSMSADCDLRMPAYQDGEDFVEDQLAWGSDTFDIYYEYPLGYLSLSSCDGDAVDRLWGDLSDIVATGPDRRTPPSS
jgi:hypothetical protein